MIAWTWEQEFELRRRWYCGEAALQEAEGMLGAYARCTAQAETGFELSRTAVRRARAAPPGLKPSTASLPDQEAPNGEAPKTRLLRATTFEVRA